MEASSEKRDLKKYASMEGRERVVMREKMLYEASMNGNIDSLNELIKEDRLVIARASVTWFDETPLHIATMLGHHDFAVAILNLNPSLSEAVDLHGRTPLHLASANGYVEIVKKLVVVNSEACHVRDEDGRTPLQLAVMKGIVDVMDELIRTRPEAIQCISDRGETLLHLAVKHNRLGALKQLLLKCKIEGDDFVNAKDEDGNTILHVAAFLKQMETIKLIITTTGVEVNSINGNGLTALDIINYTPIDLKGMVIHDYLKNAGGLKNRDNISATFGRGDDDDMQVINIESDDTIAAAKPPSRKQSFMKKRYRKHDKWLKDNRESLMVAATVIAAMAYQAGLNPPGGVWQDDKTNNHTAGESIMAYTYPYYYRLFWKYNTISFIASLSIVFVLVSGLPIKRRIFMVILMIMMWVTITSMALTYLTSIVAITPETEETGIEEIYVITILCWIGLMGVVFIGHVIRFLIWSFRKVKKLRKKGISLAHVLISEVRGHPEAVRV